MNPSDNPETEIEEWVKYQEKLFLFNLTSSRGQVGAEKECEKSGGHLATISNRHIEYFIDGLIEEKMMARRTTCLWIGLKNETGQWKWENGESLSYENWDNQDPNYVETQKCVNKQIHGAYQTKKPWFNDYCDEYGPSCGRICQKLSDQTAKASLTTQGHWLSNSTIIEMMTTTRNSKFADRNGMPFALLFPILILVALLAIGLLWHIRRRKRARTGPTNLGDDVVIFDERPLSDSAYEQIRQNSSIPLRNLEKKKITNPDVPESSSSDDEGSVFGSDNFENTPLHDKKMEDEEPAVYAKPSPKVLQTDF